MISSAAVDYIFLSDGCFSSNFGEDAGPLKKWACLFVTVASFPTPAVKRPRQGLCGQLGKCSFRGQQI